MTWQNGRFLFGSATAGGYVIFALIVVQSDRAAASAFLRGMGFFLTTFPTALPLELLGFKVDVRNNLHVALSIALCAVLVFFLAMGLARLAQFCFEMGAK